LTEGRFPEAQEYFLKPGYIYIPGEPTLISAVLGSCVAVCLWDRAKQYGGMNHFLYPATRSPGESTAKYGNIATRMLIRLFLHSGSRKEHLEAQIFGGSNRGNEREAIDIGRQNVEVARQMLTRSGIALLSQDVGGTKGRKLVYNTLTNEMVIIRVERLRDSDWYPYEGER
jgi:chemotaxis protein CheD